MNSSIYRVSLDIHTTTSQATLSAKKNDNARQIKFNLTEDGKPYTILEDCTAVFRAKKPDGTILYNDCDIEENVIFYDFTTQTVAESGILECELTLYGATHQQIASPRFLLVVEDIVYNDSEVESQDEFSALTEAMSDLATLENTVESAESGRVNAEGLRVLAELSRERAEDTRVQNETARASAESTRQSNESTRQSAESGRVSAESARVSAESSRVSDETTRRNNETARVSSESARVSAESARASAESARVTAESARASAESNRASAESTRASAESTRKSNENARKSAETSRASAETARASAESTRVSNETSRVSAESARVSAEEGRVTAEEGRVLAEDARVDAEIKRQSSITAINKKIANMVDVLNGKEFNIEDGPSPANSHIIGAGTQKYAEVGMIGGKSVVWNQLIKNGNMTNTGNWAKQPAAASINIDTDNNVLTFTMPANTASSSKRIYEVMQEKIPAGHKVLMRFDIKSDGYSLTLRYGLSDSSTLGSGSASVLIGASTIAGATDWTTIANIYERDVDCDYFVLGSLSGTGDAPVVWQIRRVNLFDLTVLFGAGNEPTTVEEFNTAYGNVYYGTSGRTIRNGAVEKIISYGAEGSKEYPIPAEIVSLGGYGLSMGDSFNYLDLTEKKYHQVVGSVNLGSLSWNYAPDNAYFYATMPADSPAVINNGNPSMCPIYDSFIGSNTSFYARDKAVLLNSYGFSSNKRIAIKDSDYTDAQTFKSAMNGVYLHYEVETPVETNVSQYLTDDNFIETEVGGTVLFYQTDGNTNPVPNKVTYMIKIEEAL